MLEKGSLPWYANAWSEVALLQEYLVQINEATDRVIQGKPRYMRVAKALENAPWQLIGAIHHLEGNCDFKRTPHNGEKIIGTGKQTVLVPKGRGPFTTWEDAAIDAYKMSGFHWIKSWTVARCLSVAERHNGLGYLNYHRKENTPYLWAQTSMSDGYGKYVADGKYDEMAPTHGQTGVVAILKMLNNRGEFSLPLV